MENTQPKRSRGGQKGNRNALKHGMYTKEQLEARKEVNAAERQKFVHLAARMNMLLEVEHAEKMVKLEQQVQQLLSVLVMFAKGTVDKERSAIIYQNPEELLKAATDLILNQVAA